MHKRFYILILSMLLTSFSEIISIGAIIPFLSVLISPDKLFEFPFISSITHFFNISSSTSLILPITILFGFAAILSGIMRVLLLHMTTKISFEASSLISTKIFQNSLFQSYIYHTNSNSSQIIDDITTKTNIITYNILLPVLSLLSSCAILFFIFFSIFIYQPFISLTAFIFFGFFYLAIIRLTKSSLKSNSKIVHEDSSRLIKLLQESLGGIRDILLDNSQHSYISLYKEIDYGLRKAQGNLQFIALSPKFLMESLGLLCITFIAYLLVTTNTQFSEIVPVLGVLAFSAQRMLPLFQNIYWSYSSIKSGSPQLKSIVSQLYAIHDPSCNTSSSAILDFRKEIVVCNLSFHYVPNRPIIKNINLRILKGQKIGIIGKTGSGKSTLIDIIMGLLSPTSGSISIDTHKLKPTDLPAWRLNVAHVPQSIFLVDSSILDNIAFGVDASSIDINLAIKCAKDACINDVIVQLPEGYSTRIGERGIRLSGGQRQRIGIARALYKKANLIILDEATSALDSKTEMEVMSSLENLNVTLIIIAHRTTTLKNCDHIFEISNGSITEVASLKFS